MLFLGNQWRFCDQNDGPEPQASGGRHEPTGANRAKGVILLLGAAPTDVPGRLEWKYGD